MSYTPDTIGSALAEARLMPALFASFLVLSFARGVVCPGGYFKDEYVPRMQKGLVSALRSLRGFDVVAQSVDGISSESYLSGMMTVLAGVENTYLVPAGPVEIIAGGGLNRVDIDKMRDLTVQDAHLAGLFETVQDVVPYDARPRDWKTQLAGDCMDLLGGKIVIK